MTAETDDDEDDHKNNEECNHNRFINVVIIGNVNAGKSSLCGRIAYDLGMVSGQTLLEYRKQAQAYQREEAYLAWYSDRANIEREKGITIHNHFHCWRFPETNLIINVTDISGYEYYLKNAIVGCALNNIAILLIDINEQFDIKGIQQLPTQNYMGSVLQQLLIIKALNIQKIIVVLNKCDLFLNNLSNYKNYVLNIKNTIINIANNLKLDIKNRFYPFIIPISITNGWNISNKYNKQNQHFLLEHAKKCMAMDNTLHDIFDLCGLKTNQIKQYNKKTLLDVVSNLKLQYDIQCIQSKSNNNMKATIKRVSVTKNHLLLLYCIVMEGNISINMKIRVHPYNIIMPIYSMQSFKETINIAYTGQLICIAIKISDINISDISYNIDNINNKFITKYFQRGSLITNYICLNDRLYGPIEYFEAELDIIYAPYDLKMGYQLSCYSHCTHFRANLIHCFDKSWNDINCMDIKRNNINLLKDTTHIYSGEKVIVGFNVIDKEIVLMNYDEYKCLGWVIIKDNKSYIVAIGKIIYCGKKVTKMQIEKAMAQISIVSLTRPIISIIADYAHCGF
eukprot:111718_1